jgi:hypothetical protein
MSGSHFWRRPVRAGTTLVVLGGLAAFSLAACTPTPHNALVVGNGSKVTLSQGTIQAGRDTFTVASSNPDRSTGSSITLFHLNPGATLARVSADLRDEFSQTPEIAAKGTRELVRDLTAYGLADVSGGAVETVTVNLARGTYHLMDLAGFNGTGSLTYTTLRVTGSGGGGLLRGNFSVAANGADRFIMPGVVPHSGSYLFTNTSRDDLHFMGLQPVKPGTTDAQVQEFYNHPTGPPPFGLPGPAGGNDVVSPGKTIQVSYNLPRGRYLATCFVADSMTGIPHVFTGMHKVIRLV